MGLMVSTDSVFSALSFCNISFFLTLRLCMDTIAYFVRVASLSKPHIPESGSFVISLLFWKVRILDKNKPLEISTLITYGCM